VVTFKAKVNANESDKTVEMLTSEDVKTLPEELPGIHILYPMSRFQVNGFVPPNTNFILL
jgi:hypothetical protein